MQIKKLAVLLLIGVAMPSVFAQNDGYWDNERATKREIVVSAGERIIIKTEDLPVGTTEVVFRITLLDENQKMATGLASILKSIPDPTGISQGSAGAVFLLSKISGDDKCKYAIFSNENLATEYKKSGKTNKACYEQNMPISKDAKSLSITESLCILPNYNAMWFGFESKNWVMNQKIILEVVPWVNKRLSSGWTLENRKLIINQCKSSEMAKSLRDSDDFCVCVLEKIQKEYKFQEFQKLLAVEKSKTFKDVGYTCFKETGASKTFYDDLRKQAMELVKDAKYSLAIESFSAMVVNGQANSKDYNSLGYAYIMTKQYGKAIKFLKEGERLDDSELGIQMNLAHAYLFNNDFKLAKEIHKKYQNQNVTNNLSWIQKVKIDFDAFKAAGLPDGDFKRVLKLLEN